MLRIIGTILICGGATAIGLSASGRLSLRIRVLSALISALDVMHSEIAFMLTPMQELLEKLKFTAPEPVKTLFADCASHYSREKDVPFSLVWTRALKDAEYLELNAQERQILIDMGGVLGRYDAEEQAKVISHARRSLEGCLNVAEKDKTRLGKLYGSLGIVCGIAIVIVFL